MRTQMAVYGVMVLISVVGLIAISASDTTADDAGPWHVVMDTKGKTAIMWNEDTGEAFFSNSRTWHKLWGAHSIWQEAEFVR